MWVHLSTVILSTRVLTFKNFIQSFELIGVRKDGSKDQAIAIKTFNWIMLCAFVAASIWAYLLNNLGQTKAAIFPIIGFIMIPCILFYSHITKKFITALNLFLTMMMTLPALVQIFHGGFVNAGAVIAWSVIVPMMSLSFRPPKVAIRCFTVFILVSLVTVLIEVYVPIEYVKMSSSIITAQFTFNLIGIITICFLPLLGFSRDFMYTRKLLKSKNKEILDSINYAQRIQSASLINPDKLDELLDYKSFTLYEPKDAIGGDFYWAYKKEDEIFLACSDCTGHGVPGAFMTLIGINHLNYIVRENGESDPGKILLDLNERVSLTLRHSEEKMRDGMDITICKINFKHQYFEYASAMSKVYFFNGEKVIRLKSDKASIGDSRRKPEFTTRKVEFENGQALYLATDGYNDQFGGLHNKKLGSRNFIHTLNRTSNLAPKEQLMELRSLYRSWKGKNDQIDDVTVIGIKF